MNSMNTNTEEWGNIELPGLSDEKLYKTNWNKSRKGIVEYNEGWKQLQKIGAEKNALENTQWLEKTIQRNIDKAKDPNRTNKISSKFIERLEDPIFREFHNQKNAIRESKKVRTPIGNFDTVKDASAALGIKPNTLRQRVYKGIEGYYIEEKNLHKKTTGKKIFTPLGIFDSKQKAADAYLRAGKKNSLKWIEKWLKTDPKNFYYIE